MNDGSLSEVIIHCVVSFRGARDRGMMVLHDSATGFARAVGLGIICHDPPGLRRPLGCPAGTAVAGHVSDFSTRRSCATMRGVSLEESRNVESYEGRTTALVGWSRGSGGRAQATAVPAGAQQSPAVGRRSERMVAVSMLLSAGRILANLPAGLLSLLFPFRISSSRAQCSDPKIIMMGGRHADDDRCRLKGRSTGPAEHAPYKMPCIGCMSARCACGRAGITVAMG